ncbi:hypothetical protein [Kitasatospora herbaricolor]|uniref:hypothetical protein n=2 Tax=Streptomycetaceae TaxID=2062 RepID=UPI00093E5D4A|nr:hypothetical protein A6A07_29130 [Streptomyces sp. CB03911]
MGQVRHSSAMLGAAILLAAGCTEVPEESPKVVPVPAPATTSAGPTEPTAIPTMTISPSRAGRPPVTREQAEQQIRELAEQAGDTPAVERLVPVFQDPAAETYWFVWPKSSGALCWGQHTWAALTRSCYSETTLPAGDTPVLQVVLGPGVVDGGHWATVFLADQQKVGRISCNGSALTLTEAGSVRTPAGTRTFYTMVTPWEVSGTLPAEVRRDGAPATDNLTMVAPTGVKEDDPRFRTCR